MVLLPSTTTLCGYEEKSTEVTCPQRQSVPKRSACFLRSAIISVPVIPSAYPGKLSISVVVVNCPPGCIPSITTGLRFARAA